MKRSLSIAVLVLAALVAAWSWFGRQPDYSPIPADNPVLGDQAITEADFFPEELVSPAEGESVPNAEPRQGSRRIVEVPSTKPLSEEPNLDAWGVKDEHLEAYAKHNIELALDNDLAAATRVDRVHRKCREAPRSLEEVERRVALTGDRIVVSDNQPPVRMPPDPVGAREEAMRLFESCQFWDEFFNQELRTQLENLASNGHVVARYLYAMWPPVLSGQPDAFFVQQHWMEKALTFTLANLTEGEAAGMLAFGNSYSHWNLFTPANQNLGYAFFVAAVDCGLETLPVVFRVTNLFERDWSAEHGDDPRPDILAMAEGLKGFCR